MSLKRILKIVFISLQAVGLGMMVIGALPILIGFGAAGIGAGTIAAGMQAAVGNVAAGSMISGLTAAAMKGYFVNSLIGGAVLCGGSAVAKHMSKKP
jgi:hypothetical protein